MPNASCVTTKACSHILVTVATLDKRAYKYIEGGKEKNESLHSTSCSPQLGQSRLARTTFICVMEILLALPAQMTDMTFSRCLQKECMELSTSRKCVAPYEYWAWRYSVAAIPPVLVFKCQNVSYCLNVSFIFWIWTICIPPSVN